jgi:hypothetical protein
MKFLSSLCGDKPSTEYKFEANLVMPSKIPEDDYKYNIHFEDESSKMGVSFKELNEIVLSDNLEIKRIERSYRCRTITLYMSYKLWWNANKCLKLTIDRVTYEEEKIVNFLKSKKNEQLKKAAPNA